MEISGDPYILGETDDFAVVFKPPKMHCVPLGSKNGDTLLEWYAALFPQVCDLMHRLDFETHGLVLFAKNKKSFDFLKSLQDSGGFVKEYGVVCDNGIICNDASGFPPPPVLTNTEPSPEKPLVIESYFRPFGPGRKQVRPVTEICKKYRDIAKDKGACYRTEIIGINEKYFTVRIKRGFRHQIRCHLCWAGLPVQNDPLYPEPKEAAESGFLALRAQALFFTDPSNEGKHEYRIAPHCAASL